MLSGCLTSARSALAIATHGQFVLSASEAAPALQLPPPAYAAAWAFSLAAVYWRSIPLA